MERFISYKSAYQRSRGHQTVVTVPLAICQRTLEGCSGGRTKRVNGSIRANGRSRSPCRRRCGRDRGGVPWGRNIAPPPSRALDHHRPWSRPTAVGLRCTVPKTAADEYHDARPPTISSHTLFAQVGAIWCVPEIAGEDTRNGVSLRALTIEPLRVIHRRERRATHRVSGTRRSSGRSHLDGCRTWFVRPVAASPVRRWWVIASRASPPPPPLFGTIR